MPELGLDSISPSRPTQEGLPSTKDDVAKHWEYLRLGVDIVMNLPERQPLSFAESSYLYNTVFNLCTSSRSNITEDPGRYLYDRLSEYFAEHCAGIAKKAPPLNDLDLLRYCVSEWDRYKTNAALLDRTFAYFNRHWVWRQVKEQKTVQKEKKKTVYRAAQLAWAQWLKFFLRELEGQDRRLSNLILNLVAAHRNGEEIEEDILDNFLNPMSSDQGEPSLTKEFKDFYEEHFEMPLLEAASAYFGQASRTFRGTHPASEYAKQAEEWLEEEDVRTKRYLPARTQRLLIERCKRALVHDPGQPDSS